MEGPGDYRSDGSFGENSSGGSGKGAEDPEIVGQHLLYTIITVSYTHLTLPTIYSV